METLLKHKGEWRAYTDLKVKAKVPDFSGQDKFRFVRRFDLKEGYCIILGKKIWTVFLYDHVRQRYFLELAFEADNEIELLKAFELLSRECI